MKTRIIGSGKLADAIKQGAAKICELTQGDDASFYLVQVGFEKAMENKKIALFEEYAFSSAIEKSSLEAGKKNKVIGTLSLKKRILGGLSENDLVRAEAFGERIARQETGFRPEKGTEKSSRIQGYIK